MKLTFELRTEGKFLIKYENEVDQAKHLDFIETITRKSKSRPKTRKYTKSGPTVSFTPKDNKDEANTPIFELYVWDEDVTRVTKSDGKYSIVCRTREAGTRVIEYLGIRTAKLEKLADTEEDCVAVDAELSRKDHWVALQRRCQNSITKKS